MDIRWIKMDTKDEYKLEIQTPETRKLVGSIKKINRQTKNGENVPSL